MKRSHTLFGLFSSMALLTACGGGGGDDTPAPAPSPLDAVAPEASQSAVGLKKYLGDLSMLQVEDREPVDLGTFAPPSAEDSEPETVS